MHQLIAVVVGVIGVLLILFGAGWALVFAMARHGFERFTKAEWTHEITGSVAELVDKVRNPIVRRLLTRHAADTAVAFVVSAARSELTSRVRVGLITVAVGVGILVSAFYVPLWWPGFMDSVILNKPA
jgi:uncharacterized protein YggT (Ycf19 family)